MRFRRGKGRAGTVKGSEVSTEATLLKLTQPVTGLRDPLLGLGQCLLRALPVSSPGLCTWFRSMCKSMVTCFHGTHVVRSRDNGPGVLVSLLPTLCPSSQWC